MRKTKLLLATTSIALISTSTQLLAARPGSPAVAAAAVKSTSQANIQAENMEAAQTAGTADKSTLTTSAPIMHKSSLYAGLGLDLLNDKGFTGLIPKASIGYGIYYGQDTTLYTALEISGGAGTILLSTNNQTYRVSNFVNASIIPGYMLYDDMMVYARLGAQSTRYSRLNSTKTGGLYGIGLQVVSNKHWDTRFEYNYANNKNLNQYIMDFIYKFSC